jgi:hypothetical protein
MLKVSATYAGLGFVKSEEDIAAVSELLSVSRVMP